MQYAIDVMVCVARCRTYVEQYKRDMKFPARFLQALQVLSSTYDELLSDVVIQKIGQIDRGILHRTLVITFICKPSRFHVGFKTSPTLWV